MQMGLKEKLFCEIAIKLGFITKAQATEALKAQRVDVKNGQKKKIGAYMLEMNLLNRNQLDQVLSYQVANSLNESLGMLQDDFVSNPDTMSEDDLPEQNEIIDQPRNTSLIIKIVLSLLSIGMCLYVIAHYLL